MQRQEIYDTECGSVAMRAYVYCELNFKQIRLTESNNETETVSTDPNLVLTQQNIQKNGLI